MSDIDRLIDSMLIGWPSDFGKTNSVAYPPHNVVKVDENKYLIEIAAAGIPKDDIMVEVEQNTLSVIYDGSSQSEFTYIHRGIATRAFTKKFKLDDHMIVGDASYDNGILSIMITREIPEQLKPRKIKIGTGKKLLLG